MSLSPTAEVTLGNQRFNAHVAAARVNLAPLPAASWFRVILPAAASLQATPGDPAELTLDGGEGAEVVLTGKIRTIKRGVLGIEVLGADASADLAALRPTATFEQRGASDVVRALCSAASVDAKRVDIALDLAVYAAHPWRTAAEQIGALAALAGAMARVDGDGTLVVDVTPGSADSALRYGREIVTLEERSAAPAAATAQVIGWGPAGTTSAPDALRPTVDVVPSGAPAPGPSVRWQSSSLIRTPGAGNDATTAAQTDDASRASRLRATCFLLPKLRPGMVIEVQDLPAGFSSAPWLIVRVQHRLAPGGGGTTMIDARAAGVGGSGGLLAAIGGLL
jgi:hypothetical protein